MIETISRMSFIWTPHLDWDWGPSSFANPDIVKVASTRAKTIAKSEERGYQSPRVMHA